MIPNGWDDQKTKFESFESDDEVFQMIKDDESDPKYFSRLANPQMRGGAAKPSPIQYQCREISDPDGELARQQQMQDQQ